MKLHLTSFSFFLCLLFSFFHCTLGTNSTSCSNIKCMHGGTCSAGVCTCRPLYGGTHCEIIWNNISLWRSLFLTYAILTAIGQAFCFAFAGYHLWLVLWKEYWKDRWTVVTTIQILCSIGSLLRLVEFSVDPHGVRGLIPLIPENTLFNVPILLWIISGFMLFLYWLELLSMTGIQELVRIHRFRPHLIVLSIILGSVVIPTSLWSMFSPGSLSLLVYNAFLSLVLILLITLITGTGLRLRRVLTRVAQRSRQSRFRQFIKSISRYIFVMDLMMFLCGLTLMIFVLIGARKMKYVYIALHFLLRMEEIVLVISTLLFVSKRKPQGGDSALNTGRSTAKQTGLTPSQSQVQQNSDVDYVDVPTVPIAKTTPAAAATKQALATMVDEVVTVVEIDANMQTLPTVVNMTPVTVVSTVEASGTPADVVVTSVTATMFTQPHVDETLSTTVLDEANTTVTGEP